MFEHGKYIMFILKNAKIKPLVINQVICITVNLYDNILQVNINNRWRLAYLKINNIPLIQPWKFRTELMRHD